MTLLLARVRASKEKTKEATYVKDVGTRAHSVLSLRSFSLQFHFLQPFTPSHGHFCSNRSHRRHRELSLSLSLSLISFYVNSETLAPCEITVFFFFWGMKIWGFWSIMIGIYEKIQRHFNFFRYLSPALFLLWKMYLFLFVICFLFFFLVEIKPT